MEDFDYLIEKVSETKMAEEPFPHVYIENFLSIDHFKRLVDSPAIRVPEVRTVGALFDALATTGYQPIEFPGCTTDRDDYVKWLDDRERPNKTHLACEAQGMTLRHDGSTDTGVPLDEFLKSQAWQDAVRSKFGITQPTRVEAGLQKYLNGYEISPHPDVREKALTWMLNLNPAENSEDLDIHTHYLRLVPERAYIYDFWRYNQEAETSWLPWDWCTTATRQTANNSLVIFSPSWQTIHAVRADYDHLKTQRTQMYGNLWYQPIPHRYFPQFRDLDILTPAGGDSSRARLLTRVNAGRTKARRYLGKGGTWPPSRNKK